jgi:hypothetical protein
VQDPSNLCKLSSCNGTDCVNSFIQCNGQSLTCITTACNVTTGLCESNPVICPDDNNACTSVQCVEGTGCVPTTKICPPPSDACLVPTGCDTVTGGCGTVDVDCDDNIFCTVDSCDPVAGCKHDPQDSLCIDPNPCTNFSQCLNTTGNYTCVSTPVDCGGKGLFCSNFSCVDYFGCSNDPRDCKGNISNKSCSTYNCSEVKQSCEKVEGVCFNFLGVVVGIVVGGLIGGVIAAALFILGLSAGGAAAAYSSSANEDNDRAIKENPLFKGQGRGGIGLGQ